MLILYSQKYWKFGGYLIILLSYRDLDAEMSSLAKAHYKSPSPPPSVSSASSSSSDSTSSSSSSSSDDNDSEHLDVDDDNEPSKFLDSEQGHLQPPGPFTNKQGRTQSSESVIVPGLKEREYVDEYEHGGLLYRVGDVVLLTPVR